MTPVAIRESPQSRYPRPLTQLSSIATNRRYDYTITADYHTTTQFRYPLSVQSLHLDRGVGSITTVVRDIEGSEAEGSHVGQTRLGRATALFLDTPLAYCYGAMRMRPSARKSLFAILAVVVLGSLIYASRDAIHLEGFSWDKLASSVRHADVSLLLLALLGIHVCLALRSFRWLRFSRYLDRATYSNIYVSTVIGFSALFLLGRAAEPVRPLLISRKEGIPVSSEFGIYVLERMFDMGSTVVIAAVALLAVPRVATAGAGSSLLNAARNTGIVLLAGLTLGVAFLVYFRLHGAARLERRIDAWRASGVTGWRQRVAGLVAGFSQGLQAIRNVGDFLVAVACSAAHWMLIAGAYFLVARSFGGRLAELRLSDALLVLAFTMAGSTIQLPGVGGGSQVASFLAYSVILGVDKEPAAAAAIVVWLITFAGSTVLGIPLLIKEGWSMGELRRLASAEKDAEAHGGHIDVNPDASARGDLRR